MKPSDSSASKRSNGESPRLTAALAFGFAAGALFARKPAAAITAVATGLIACASSRRSNPDSASVSPWNESYEENPPLPIAQSASDIRGATSTTPHVQAAEFPPLDPLPEFGHSSGSGEIAEVDTLASLSLPELDSSLTGKPVITPVATIQGSSIVKPRTLLPAPEGSPLSGNPTIALDAVHTGPGVKTSRPAAAEKKSWMSWWQ